MTDRPICAVCNRPVEKITRWDNPRTMIATFTVQCHGAVEACELSAYQAHQAGPDGISFGRAFVPPAALEAS